MMLELDLSPKTRELYDMAVEQMDMHEGFQKVPLPKRAKKRRVRSSAA